MKRWIVGLVIVAACSGRSEPTTGSATQAVWTNGDFESDPIGTAIPTGWTRAKYLNPGITDTRPSPQTLASLNLGSGGVAIATVIGGAPESQTDPDIGATGTLRYPKYGQRAAVINNTSAGKNQNANSLVQQMTVGLGDVDPTDNKVHVRFAVAPVLENPNHAYTQQPYYFVRLNNLTTGITLYQDFNASGQPGVPWKNFTDASSQAAQYTDWQLVDISPGNASLAVGDNVELLVLAAGCSAGGHWGRLYVDAVGSGIPGLYAWATGAQQANAGSDVTYTVNYKNGGTTTTSGSQLDLVTPPSTVYKSTTATACTAPATGATGTVSCPLGTLAPGATGSFTITVTIPAGTTAGTQITNGNYSIYASGVSALVGPKVYTNITSGTQYANLGITKTDGVAAIGWGQPDTYTVVVANAGPLASSATVTDPMPAQLANVTWACAATGGATCSATGTGSISDTVSLPVGATLTYTVQATIVAGTGAGSVINTATVTPTGAIVDPDSTNNDAVDTDTIGTLRTLTVTSQGTPSAGTINSTPAAISCGVACAASFLDNSQVVLTAAPITGATFVGWAGACSGKATTCTVTMAGAQNVTANFVGAPSATTVSSGSAQQTAISTAFAAPLAVRVTDAAGTPVPNVTVAFAGPGTGADATLSAATAVTDAAGIASITATANATAGAYTVTASITGVTPVAGFALSNLGAPSTIAVQSGGAQSATVAAPFANLVALVRDAANQPVPNVTVTFAAPGSGASASLGTTATTTDANGLASVGASAGTIAGTYAVTASAPGVATPASFALTNTAGAATALAIAAGTDQSTTVNTDFATAITARVVDAFGNAVAGTAVTFTAPASGPSAGLATPASTSPASGLVSTTATASTLAGAYSITASAAGLASITFSLANTPDVPATIVATGGGGQSATVHSAFALPLQVVVRDRFDNVVPGAAVTFTPAASAATAAVSSTTTDVSGVAATSAFASTTAGAYAVTASIGAGSVGFALTNTAGAAATATITAGGGQSATVGQAFATAIQISVVDTYGNPVANAAVTLTAPATGASLATSSIALTTGPAGTASTPITANHVSGAYSVTVSVPGVATSPSIGLTNRPGTATSLAVVSGDAQHAVVTTTFASPLVVIARDGFGNAAPAAAVTFSAPGATFAPATATTDAYGQASSTATAGTTAGAYAATAAITGASTTFALTNDPGAAATVSVAGGNAQSATVAHAFVVALAVHVTDAHGNDVPDANVTFTAPASGARATLAPGSATTGSTGRAAVAATAAQLAGAYDVTASVTGATPATFSLTNTADTVAALTATGGDAQSAVVLVPFAQPLVVHAADQFGNAVPSAVIAFAATQATFPGAGTAITDANGNAQIIATAGTEATSYLATASSNSATASFALANLPGAAATIAIADGSGQQAIVAQPFSAGLHAIVQDAHGNVVPGVTVTFVAAASPATAAISATTATSGTDGLAATTATASTVTGSYDITASITGASAAFHLTNTADVPASITAAAIATPQQMIVLQPYAAALATTVRDRFGNAVPGAIVTYAAPATEPSAALSAPTATSDATGLAEVTATAGSRAGAFLVRASVTGVDQAAAFSLANTAGTPASLVIAGGDGQAATADTDFAQPLAVEVLDANGNPVPGAVVGFIAPLTPATAVLASSSAQTDSTGIATVTAHASQITGSYQITASLTGSAAPIAFTLANTPGPASAIEASLGSTPQNTQVDHPFVQPLVARVSDAFGNNIPGAVVTFAAPPTGATGALMATSATTGDDGRASTSITAGTVSGAFVVSATTAGVAAAAAFRLANLAGPAHSIAVAVGNPQSATVTTAFAQPLVVLVEDDHGNPVPSALVTFAAPITGATATLADDTVVTAPDGTAQTTVVAGTIAGDFAITATTPSGGAPALFALTAQPGPAAAAAAVAGATPQSTEVLHAFAQPLGVIVTDAYGNRVPGAHVTFSAPSLPGAQLSAASTTTGSDGVAGVLALADAASGAFTVSAAIDGTSGVDFALANLAASPSNVVITAGGAQQTLATTAFARSIELRVTDAFGNPVPATPIAIVMPTTGPTAAMSDPRPVTDVTGSATISLVAGATVGRFTLSAQVDGALTPATSIFEVQAIPTMTTATADTTTPVDDVSKVTIAVGSSHGTPAGTVDIVDADGTTLGSAALADGTAVVTVSGLAIGAHALTARFAAQGSFAASTSSAVALTITGDTGSLSGGGCDASGNAGGSLVVLAVVALVLARRRRARVVSAMVGALLASHVAVADPDGARAIDRYHAASAESAWFALDSATFTGHREIALSLVGDYAREPLDIYAPDGSVRDRVVTDAFIVQLGASISLYDRLRLSATVPMAPWQQGNGGTYNGMALASPDYAFGDVSLAGDVRVLGGPSDALRVVTGVRVTLPSGSTTNFMSDGHPAVEPRVVAAGTVGMWEYATAASAFVRGTNEVAGARFGSELRYAAAGGARLFGGRLLVGPELVGAVALESHTAIGTPVEVQVGAHYTASRRLRVSAGTAFGIVNAIGEPRWRMIAALTYCP
ncbi:MAG: Ig-like domain-containing protein [Kofleriaceae bacterium]